MKFPKEDLSELVWDEVEGYEVVRKEFHDKRRWTTTYEMIFKFQDKFYRTFYDVGNTEYQEQELYEYEPDEIECKEVIPVEKVVIDYKEV